MVAFYQACRNLGPSVLVIQAQNSYVFGAFVSDNWKQSRLYYGSGDCFLYTFYDTEKIKCFYSSYRNEYYM